MSEVLHANIFFFIASAATVVFCILVSVILYQVYKITRSIRTIVERVEAASETVAEDVAHVRALVAKGSIVKRILNFILGNAEEPSRARKRSRTSD